MEARLDSSTANQYLVWCGVGVGAWRTLLSKCYIFTINVSYLKQQVYKTSRAGFQGRGFEAEVASNVEQKVLFTVPSHAMNKVSPVIAPYGASRRFSTEMS